MHGRPLAAALIAAAALFAGCITAGTPTDAATLLDDVAPLPPAAEPPRDASRAEEAASSPSPSAAAQAPLASSGEAPIAPAAVARDPLLPPRAPTAVLALIDDGVNPYHAAFRDRAARAWTHPSTYLDGYPADAEAIHLTFDHPSLAAALVADCAEWAKVQPGRLYWFPGTKIVGAITFGGAPVTCEHPRATGDGDLVGLDGHGTMTASRAAGNVYGACPECRLVVVQGLSAEGVRWAAQQPWIDLQSNSWQPFVPAPTPGVGMGATQELARAVEEAARVQPSFWAAGNGVVGQLGLLGQPTQVSPHYTPSVVRVGGHDSGRVAVWPGSSPHVVSDACSSWAAEHDTLDVSTPHTGGGTSAATPFAAGVAARILLEARAMLDDVRTGPHEGGLAHSPTARLPLGPLEDGRLTKEELLSLLFRTADPRPKATEQDGDACDALNATSDWAGPLYGSAPVAWRSVPEGPAAVPLVGYGAVTLATAERAADVLRGATSLPARAHEDAWFSQDRDARERLHQAYVGGP